MKATNGRVRYCNVLLTNIYIYTLGQHGSLAWPAVYPTLIGITLAYIATPAEYIIGRQRLEEVWIRQDEAVGKSKGSRSAFRRRISKTKLQLTS